MRFSFRLLPLLAAALLVPACGTQKRKEPPVITFTSPAGGDTGIPRQLTIYIRYDKALNASTVTESRFLLADGGGTIPCFVTYHPELFEVRMTPKGGAIGSDTLTVVHQVTILAGLMASDGAAVEVSLFFQFTTKASTDFTRPSAPGALSAGSATTTTLTLTWTAATDDVSVDHYDVFMALAPNAEDLTNRLLVGTSPQVISGLAASTTYYFIVRAVDGQGNTDLNTSEVFATTLP